MRDWFQINLGDAMLAQTELEHLQARITRGRDAAGQAGDMAAFVRHESEGRLHCEVVVYLSPACREVAKSLSARPCARPSPRGLELLAGSPEAARRLFPETANGAPRD